MSSFFQKYKNPILGAVFFTIAILVPLLPLFPMDGIFLGDWVYHLWPIGFNGQYLKTHHYFPMLVNSKEMVFLPAQIFYGHIFYPLLGFFSQWGGPNVILRIAVILLFSIQFFLVYQLIEDLSKNRAFSFLIACLVNWSIYPLTNLYNRSALTELFATLLLSGCLCSWLLMIFKNSKKEKIIFGVLGGWCLALAFGSHPITALFGSFFLLVAGISLIPLLFRRTILNRRLVMGLVFFSLSLTFLVNLPWIYLNHLMLQKIFISNQGLGLFFYAQDIDSWPVRFGFYPHDLRVHNSNIVGVPNPYLDAQINMPLLLLLIFGGTFIFSKLIKKKTWPSRGAISLLSAGILLFILSTWMSLDAGIYNRLPHFAAIIQFVYRMITYQNLALFLTLISILVAWPDLFNFKINQFYKMSVLLTCLGIAALGIYFKNAHALAVRVLPQIDTHDEVFDFSGQDPRIFLKMPANYNTSSYISSDIAPWPQAPSQTIKKVVFELGTDKNYGDPLPLDFDVQQSQWVNTNVAAFDWNSLSNNGQKIPTSSLYNLSRFMTFWAVPGHYHLQTYFEPDPVWLKLRQFSFPAAGVLTLIPLLALLL